jgi:hypothetical protein
VRAHDHDVAGRDGLWDVEDAALLDAWLPLRSTGHSPRLGVPSSDVEAFDDDGSSDQRGAVLPACTEPGRRRLPALLVADDALDDATLARVLACEHHDLVTTAHVRHASVAAGSNRWRHHNTSGAREMIFM